MKEEYLISFSKKHKYIYKTQTELSFINPS